MNESAKDFQPFSGTITDFVDDLPLDSMQLPDEVESHAKETAKGMDKKYILVKDGQNIIGFAICFFPKPEDSDQRVMFHYRYVNPEHRGQGIGKMLRDEVYANCLKLGYREVSSGVNDVIKINSDGLAIRNFESEGGYGSYLSMTRSDSEIHVRHEIDFITTHWSGYVDLSFITHLGTEKDELMPADPNELLQLILSKTPPVNNPREILPDFGATAYKDGKELSMKEFMSLLKSS